jgi:meiotically up-regulated gene 157 (Mug157) protein
LAYEVDGFGNQLFMDDANVPSLLAMPYLGSMPAEDEVYQNTRRMVLSESNPYFFKGKVAEGIGGPHVGLNYIWPMGIIIRAITSNDKAEIMKCINWLKISNAGTGFMHESFNKDDASDFTRKWFAWANTLFGELIIKVHRYHPEILG